MGSQIASVRALAIDDDESDLLILRRIVEDMQAPQIELRTRHDSTAVMELLEGGHVDLLLLDYDLKRETGLDVVKRVRSAGIEIPIILLTGRGDEETAVRSMQAGASDYLPKFKLNVESLSRSIKNAMDKYRMRCELDAQRVELEETVDHLRTRNTEIQSFYHTLSHELKTPLTSASEFISIVLDEIAGTLTDEQRRYLNIAQKSCGRMTASLNDILDVVRIETGKMSVELGEVSLGDCVRHVVECTSARAVAAGIVLVAKVPEGLPPAHADEGRIIQVFTNLAENSLKFTERGGQITIEVAVDQEGRLRSTVRDDGCGIEPDHIPRLFDRLYQVREKDSDTKRGMGLGLSICQELLRLHNGEIWVESRVGKGTAFHFTVPVHESLVAAAPSPSSNGKPPPSSSPA